MTTQRVVLLDDGDVISAGDFARPLDLVHIGQSDTLLTSNTYSGRPANHTRWVTVERLGFGEHIIGKWTVGEYNAVCDGFERPHQPTTRYEFCRGNVPAHKQLPETERERAHRLDQIVAPYGKHKGLAVREIKTRFPAYYEWAEREGLIAKWARNDPRR